MSSPTGAILLAAAVALLAACGGESGSESDQEAEIERAWSAFVGAVEDQDGETACAELSAQLAEEGGIAQQIGAARPDPGLEGCAELLSEPSVTTLITTDAPAELEAVEIDGSTASGTAGAAAPTFVLEDGEWKLESIYGAPPP